MNYNRVVPHLPYRDYDAHPGVRISNLRSLARSPRHFEARTFEDQETTTEALELGRLLHDALQPEGQAVLDGLIAKPEDLNLNTAEGRRWKSDALAAGKRPVPRTTWELLTKARERIHQGDLKPLFENADFEVSMFWSIGIGPEARPIRCKARVDVVPQAPNARHALMDFKSVTSGEPRAAWYAALQYGWFLQAAWYLWGWNLLNPEEMRGAFTWVLFEKEPPYGVYLYAAPQHALDRARDEIAQLLARLDGCLSAYGNTTGAWPDQAAVALQSGNIPLLEPPQSGKTP